MIQQSFLILFTLKTLKGEVADKYLYYIISLIILSFYFILFYFLKIGQTPLPRNPRQISGTVTVKSASNTNTIKKNEILELNEKVIFLFLLIPK